MGSSYDDWTVHQLKWTLKERGLPVSGKKRVLIERLESSEGLEGSMAASKPISEEKNYLEEWALDAEDADLVEQIRERYRAPSYKTSSKREKQPYPLKLSIAIIVLCFIGICGPYFIYSDEPGSTENRTPCFIALLLFLILYAYVNDKNKKMDLSSKDVPDVAIFLVVIGILLIIPALYFLSDGDGESVEDGVTCCSSLILVLIPLSLFSTSSADEKLKEDEQREKYEKRKWEDAQKHEEHSHFDAATEIWEDIGKEGEVKRVAELKVEYMCVILKRKIRDLTGKGADCTQLEEQWATIETALEGGATSLSSVGMEGEEVTPTVKDSTITPSPDIDLEEHTGESLKEIEEDEEEEHTLVKDSVVSQINAGAGEDDKLDKLKELIEMKEKGLIDDDELKQMMMEIMGTESEE